MAAWQDPARRCLKVAEWPPSHQRLWSIINGQSEPEDRRFGLWVRKRPATIDKTRRGYGRWLATKLRDEELSTDEDATSLIAVDSVRAYVRELLSQGVSPGTIRNRLSELLAVAQAFSPEKDWTWLRRGVSYYDREAQEQQRPEPRMLAGTVHSRIIKALQQTVAAGPAICDLKRYRDLMIVGVFVATALRRKNVTESAVGRNLTEIPRGYRLVFSSREMKTHRRFETELTTPMAAHMQVYLQSVRPTFVRGEDTGFLWLSLRTGKPLASHTIHQIVAEITEQELGIRFGPHEFRRMAATAIAILDPKNVDDGRAVLGHLDPKTTRDHYELAGTQHANARVAQTVLQLRQQLSSLPPDS